MLGRFLAISRLAGSATDDVVIINQDKTITENGTYVADSGYSGFGTVVVNVENERESYQISTNKMFDDIKLVTYNSYKKALSVYQNDGAVTAYLNDADSGSEAVFTVVDMDNDTAVFVNSSYDEGTCTLDVLLMSGMSSTSKYTISRYEVSL